MKKKIPLKFEDNQKIYAGFWKRLGAMVCDLMIIVPISFCFMKISNMSRLNYLYTFIPNLMFIITYHIYFVKKWGGTPGKLLLKLKIIRIDGEVVGWKEAILRHSVHLVISITNSIFSIIFLISITDAEFSKWTLGERSQKILVHLPYMKYFEWLSRIFGGSEFLVFLLNKRNRALHDLIAGTVVVNKSALAAIDAWNNQK